MADARSHDLSAFATVEALLFDLRYEGLHSIQDLCTSRHALLKLVLPGDLIVTFLKVALIRRFFFDQVALLETKSLESFLQHLLAMHNRVARQSDYHLTHAQDRPVSDVERF